MTKHYPRTSRDRTLRRSLLFLSFFFSSRRRHTRYWRDWSSDVCSSDLAGEDHADREAQEAVHPAHPLGVALGQVDVDRDHVDAVAGERVEVRGQDAGQRLALTGAHLSDVAQVQRGATHELHPEVPLAQGAGGGLADDGEGLREEVVEGLDRKSTRLN